VSPSFEAERAPKLSRHRSSKLGRPARITALNVISGLQRSAGNQAVASYFSRPGTTVQRGLLGDLYRLEQKKKSLLAALAKTPQGQHALEVKDKYQITLVWQDGGAAAFDGGSQCSLNQTLDVAVLAGYLVHEMYHVERQKTGASPDADMSADEREYVDRMVNEEIEGTALAFEARIGVYGPLMPGEEYYRLVYENQQKKSMAGGKDASTADAEAKAAARRVVPHLIRPQDGSQQRIGPNMLESYEMYYRRVWRTSPAHRGAR
jgi:hypothetical protein